MKGIVLRELKEMQKTFQLQDDSSAGTYTINVYQNGTLPSGIEDQPFAFVCNIL